MNINIQKIRVEKREVCLYIEIINRSIERNWTRKARLPAYMKTNRFLGIYLVVITWAAQSVSLSRPVVLVVVISKTFLSHLLSIKKAKNNHIPKAIVPMLRIINCALV